MDAMTMTIFNFKKDDRADCGSFRRIPLSVAGKPFAKMLLNYL